MAQLKDSLITGDLRVTGTIYGKATNAVLADEAIAVRDKGNGTLTYLNYGAAGMSTTSWVGSWDGYTLKAISPANLKTTMALNNVENTKLSTWTGSSNITTIGTLSSGTVPWARLSGVPSSFTPASHTHYLLATEGDNRTTATTPNNYTNQLIFRGLKTNANFGTPSSDTYSYVVGLRGWTDSSGGDSHELAFNNSGIYWRHGATTTWSTWDKIATKSELNTLVAATDAMVFKGTLGTGGTITALPNSHTRGDTYRVITAGTYAGVVCEVGDLIMCINSGTAAANADWTVAQTNLDGAVIGPASATNGNFVLFDGTTGKLLKNSSYSPSSFATSGHTHTISIAADSGTNALTLAHGTKYKLTAGGSSFIFTMPASGNTDTKQNIVLDDDVKAYITGVTTTPTETAQALTGVADTGVYLTTQPGEINASIYSIDENAQIYYDPENEAIGFAFLGELIVS